MFGLAHRPSPQTVALQRAASSAIAAIRNTNRSRLKRKRPSPIRRHQPVGFSAHVLSRFLLTRRPAYRRRRLAGAVVRLDRRCLDHAAGCCCRRRRQRLGARAGQPAGAVDRTDAGRRRGCLHLRRRRRCTCLGVIEPGGSRARRARPADRCAGPAWQRLCGVAAGADGQPRYAGPAQGSAVCGRAGAAEWPRWLPQVLARPADVALVAPCACAAGVSA